MAKASGGLPCKEVIELMTDYLEGALTVVMRNRCEVHLAACRHCSLFLSQLKMTIRLSEEVGTEKIDPQAKRRLMANLEINPEED